jgi:hypothetical protein
MDKMQRERRAVALGLGLGAWGLTGCAGMGAEAGATPPPGAGALQWGPPQRRGSGWYEWRAAPPAAWGQRLAFDPGQIDLQVQFEGPGGRRLRCTAFFSIDADGPLWKVRLLPPLPGRWTGRALLRLDSGPELEAAALPVLDLAAVVQPQRVTVDAQSPTTFAFDDGRPYIPVGLNIAWSVGPDVVADYRRWFQALAAQGGNIARLWMASWSFGLEWQDTGLGDYTRRMPRAEQLDAVLELAEEHGIRVMLCMINHGAFNPRVDAEWDANPYNRRLGGPLDQPEQFVSHPQARQLFARRLRYTAARWAHSPALLAWEWWNEINWTPITDAALLPWLQEMNAVLDRHDPYQRLRSTSGHEPDSVVWRQPGMHFLQEHRYTKSDPLTVMPQAAAAWRQHAPRLPVLMAEFGLDPSFQDVPQAQRLEAIQLHDANWAAVLAGFAGSAMYWWWDRLVDPQGLWPAYRGIASFTTALTQAGLRLGDFAPVPVQVEGGGAQALAASAPGALIAWVRADPSNPAELPANRPVRPGVRLRLPGQAALVARITADAARWIDPPSGRWHSAPASPVGSAGDALELTTVPFGHDAAVIVRLRPPA